MTVPTVAVTVRLADFGGPAVAGVKITARLSDVDYTAAGTFVSTDPVSGLTDATGTAVLNVFPNAVGTGLGTRGTTVLFHASMPGSRSLKVEARVPNSACNLVDILIPLGDVPLTDAELALLQVQAAAAEADSNADASAASASAAAGSATSAAGSASAAATSAIASASSAATSFASQLTAVAAASQASLLAGVTGVYATNAAMQTGIATIAANANVMVLADEVRQGQVSIYQKVSGVMTYQGTVLTNAGSVGALGDVNPENCIWLFNGDSTTESLGNSGFGFDQMTTEYRKVGGPLEKIVGIINFGGSGHKLTDWVNQAVGALPTYSTSNLGVSQNDYFGHKAVGATSLATQLAWRANLAADLRVVWSPCYGINDVILSAAVGNLSQQAITDYTAGLLRQAIRKILSAFPRDKILLRCPNPMTARPFTPPGPGFPSITEYPNFGLVDATDQALVEKWNQGLRNGYLDVRNEFSGVALFDKWELVYGPSDTTKTATTQLPFLTNLVHPGSSGSAQEVHQMLSFMAPNARVKRRQLNGRHAWAVAYAAVNSVNPWEQWPAYLDNNYKYQFVIEGVFNARGTTFLDITLKTSDFTRLARGRGIYVQVAEAAAQFFATYTVTDLGATDTVLRLTGISPSAAMQAAGTGLPVRIYVDSQPKLAVATTVANTLNETNGVFLPEPFPSGGTFSASTGTAVPSTVTIEVYSVATSARTLLGTISIGANAVNASLASGNPASTVAGAWYEFKVTSATVAGNRIQCKFTPS